MTFCKCNTDVRSSFGRVDLVQLVEEAMEGCWIGYRARLPAMNHNEVGSVYAPPSRQDSQLSSVAFANSPVEAVIDIAFRVTANRPHSLARRRAAVALAMTNESARTGEQLRRTYTVLSVASIEYAYLRVICTFADG